MALLTGEGVGALQLTHSLFLILLVQVVLSQLAQDESPMMQKTETGTQDSPPRLLEKRTSKHRSLTAGGLWNSPSSLLSRLLPSPAGSRPKRSMTAAAGECRLESQVLLVKDLGFGYNSEETIRFRYCTGSCPMTNYDLAMFYLSEQSGISGLREPCCRPTAYETEVFLDDSNQWQKIQQLSASACGCVG